MKCETTIFVPTHNRPTQLNRLLRFLEDSAQAIRIVIADSSDEERHAQNLKNVQSNRLAENILVLPYQDWDITDKYLEGLRAVETDTVCICGDDDLVFPEQILACSRFLDEHQDYSYARGRMVTFIDSPRKIGLRDSIRPYDQRDISMNDPIERICHHLNNYRSNFYSVKRTAWIIRNLAKALKLDVGWGLQERLVPILDLLDGKGALLQGLFMARQIGQNLVDENGNRTLPGARLDGRTFAEDATRNSNCYLEFVEQEASSCLGRKSEAKLLQLRRALQKDVTAYYRSEAYPNSISLSEIRLKLRSRVSQFVRVRLHRDNSRRLETVVSHILRHRLEASA